MAEPTIQYVGIGKVAAELGVSRSALRLWEKNGLIPAAPRLAGSGRRVYVVDDIEDIRSRLEAKRAAARQRGGPVRAA